MTNEVISHPISLSWAIYSKMNLMDALFAVLNERAPGAAPYPPTPPLLPLITYKHFSKCSSVTSSNTTPHPRVPFCCRPPHHPSTHHRAVTLSPVPD